MNYYRQQLKKLKKDSEFNLKIKIFDSLGNSTNCLDLSSESIPIIKKFLDSLTSEVKNENKFKRLQKRK